MVLLVWQSTRLMTRPIYTDEAEHAHVAYRIARGERPFRDFFEHHCPGLWYLLLPYFKLGGYGAGVLFWGRCLSVISLLCVAGLSYLIGRRLGPPLTGELAALLILPYGIANQYLQVRPEMVMIPLLLGGIYAAFRFLDDRASGWWLIAGAGLISLGGFFSPRFIIAALWLGIVYILNFRRMRLPHHIIFFLVAGTGPFLLLETVGFHNAYWWIYRFSGNITTHLSLSYTWRLLADKFIILIGTGVAVLFVIRGPLKLKYLGLLQLISLVFNLIYTLRGSMSFPYAWTLTSLAAAITFACFCAWLLDRKIMLARLTALGLLIFCIPSSVSALTQPAMMTASDGTSIIPNPATLAEEVAEMDGFCRRYRNRGSAFIVWDMDVPFIAIQDVSYFWFLPFDIATTLDQAGIAGPKPKWSFNIRRRRPFVISENIVREVAPSRESDPDWWGWFDRNYRLIKRPRGDYLYWRRDIEPFAEDVVFSLEEEDIGGTCE